MLGQQAVPLCRRGAEDDAAVTHHAQRALGVVVLETALLYKVLRHGVASTEEDLEGGLAGVLVVRGCVHLMGM